MSENNKQQIQLQPNALNVLEYVSTRFDALIMQGVKVEDLLDPAFWAHHAVRMKPMDEIRARAEDGTWVAYYVVLDCSRTWARVHQLSMHRLTTGQVAETQASEAEVKAFIERHNVVFRGVEHKWSVTRKADKAVVKELLGTKDEAIYWLKGFAREQVGAPAPKAAAAVAA